MMDLKTAATLLHATSEAQDAGIAFTLDEHERDTVSELRAQAQRVIDRAVAGGRQDEVIRETALVKMRAAARVHELVLERSR
ncbi:hypothetical protein GS504_15865 [Rhodococcus hoagii]|nr:hypothetical protein [Prescottella equi]